MHDRAEDAGGVGGFRQLLSRVVPLLFPLAIACGAGKNEAPPPAGPVRPEPARAQPPPEASDAGTPVEQADAVVNRALGVVSRMRQLAPKGQVRGRAIGRREMLDHVKGQLRSEIPEHVLRANNEMLFALNVVPSDFDYEKSLLKLLEAQLAGFYEPRDKTMYLLSDLPSMEREATLAHELVHALQDQHYDLGKLVKYRDDATDALSAIHALAEGDATSAMLDHMLIAQGRNAIDVPDEMISLQTRGLMEISPALADVPSIIKRSIISPYVDGILLVHFLRRRGGWSEVDAVWRNPPTTTEQLLHPEKLLSREPALAVALPAAARGGPAEIAYHDVLGEQSLRLLFEEWVPRQRAVDASRGWGGDRVAVFRDGERFSMAWRLRFDDEAAARRSFEVLLRGVLRDDLREDSSRAANEGESPPAAAQAAATAASVGRACRERARRGPMAGVRNGRDVVVVAGPFRRKAGAPSSDGTCAQALAWADSIVRAP